MMAADLVSLMDTLGITGKVALAGMAVGGAIALHTAALFPNRVAAWGTTDGYEVRIISDLLTYGSAKMSGLGAELERTGLGPHALPQKRSPFHGVCAVKTKYRTGIGPHLRMRKRQ
jgi:pimeloyl-ACP methyl ester carboxylesterase